VGLHHKISDLLRSHSWNGLDQKHQLLYMFFTLRASPDKQSQRDFWVLGKLVRCIWLIYHVTLKLNNNMSTVVIFFDIENAYGNTLHSGLLYKLSKFQFLFSVIKRISSLLSNRKFRNSIEGEMSTPRKIRWPFVKLVDSSYYSESELCGGAVTVSFSKYLPWQARHFLQRSTHFSKTCCRQLITSKFLVPEFPFLGSKSPEIAWGEIWI
jgi:hypothetical protein